MSVNQTTLETAPFVCPRIWSGEAKKEPQVRLFRRTFDINGPLSAAQIRLFAELRYHLWINGSYIGRGPVFHHPNYLPYDTYDLRSYLKPGRNVVAVLVATPNFSVHNAIPRGEPGLLAEITWQEQSGQNHRLVTDQQWRITEKTGWRSDTPKRCWALARVEAWDANVAPQGWQELTFDDSAWQTPDVFDPPFAAGDYQIVPRDLPQLTYELCPAQEVTAFYGITAPPQILAPTMPVAYGQTLMDAAWTKPAAPLQLSGTPRDGLRIRGLSPAQGAVVCLDMGTEVVGQVVVECDCDSGGIVDVGWSELLVDNKPHLLRKGVSYCDQITAKPGPFRWEPHSFSGLRYLVLILRNFTGNVTCRFVGARVSQPELPWQGEFSCDDANLTGIWKVCERTIRVGTQEGLMDCPTREQAPYVGDGHPVARWISRLTGDMRHWRYLTREQFRRPSPEGLLRSSLFTGANSSLIDYDIHAIIGTLDYYRQTGDLDMVCEVMPACRKVLGWFESQCNDQGLFAWVAKPPTNNRGWENFYEPETPTFIQDAMLFIDHPGMGWHNVNEPGIDRRGLNTAINALLVMGREALAELELLTGNPQNTATLKTKAAHLRRLVHETFFDATRGVYADGRLDGTLLSQVSQQANTWAVMAGCCDQTTAKSIMNHIITTTDPKLARNGPYFWYYTLAVLASLGMHRQAVQAIGQLWQPMLKAGATTLWETFAGDNLDTWCHPWSGAPLDFLLTEILGLPDTWRLDGPVTLRPRYDLLKEARGKVLSQRGPISISWSATELSGQLPEGVSATVLSPEGKPLGTVRGTWTLRH